MPLRCIQVVDSDPTVALVTQRGLQMLLNGAVEVAVSASPEDAWLRCAQGSVDLLIIDPNPHNGAAKTLLTLLQSYRPSIPVIALTAYDSPRLQTQMRTLGVQYYLAKPVELQELERIVRAALGLEPLRDGESGFRPDHDRMALIGLKTATNS